MRHRLQGHESSILVEFDVSVTPQRKKELVQELGCQFLQGFDENQHLAIISVPAGSAPTKLLAFTVQPEVRRAER